GWIAASWAGFSRSDGGDYRPWHAPAGTPVWRFPHGLRDGRRGAFLARRCRQLAEAGGAGGGLHVVQLAGRDPSIMAEAARLAQDSGAAMIDINMGCPAKAVTNGYAGSHLMRDVGLAISLIRATVAAVRIPVTLKMRLGWDARTVNAPELGRLAGAEGIAMLSVHGRTRCQFYAAKADWAAIGEVKKAVSIPVAANGDCASLADAAVMLAQSGADAVMIGRSAAGQP